MTAVYLCIGSDEDYEEQSRWVARVFAREADAAAWVARANAAVVEWRARRAVRRLGFPIVDNVSDDRSVRWLAAHVGDPLYGTSDAYATACEPSYEVEAHEVIS